MYTKILISWCSAHALALFEGHEIVFIATTSTIIERFTRFCGFIIIKFWNQSFAMSNLPFKATNFIIESMSRCDAQYLR